jgi:CHASE2 domain-containing sensor protein
VACFFIWLVTGEYNHTITQQTLVLLGISAATGLSATAIDSNKENVTPGASLHTNFLHDILTDANGLAFHRYQIFLWTLMLGVFYVVSVYRTAATPDFDTNLLTLMGISSGTYLGFKIPEKQN